MSIILSKHSVSRNLIFYVILFSSFITFISSAFQLYETFESEVDDIKIRLDDIFNFYTQSVTTTLWTANHEDLKTNLEGIIKIPDVVYVRVIVDGEEIISLGIKHKERIVVLEKEISYLYRNQNINLGSLYIQASLESAYQNVIDKIIQILISNGIKTFLVAFFILYIFNYLVTRHLQRIAKFTHELDSDKLDATLSLDRKKSKYPDELDEVVTGITSLQGNIVRHIRQIELSEARVLLLLNSTAEAIYGIDTFGVCTFVNASCLEMLGYDHESELLGKNMHEMIHYKYSNGDVYPVKNCQIYKAYLTGMSSHSDDEVLWRKDGSFFPVEYWSYPISHEKKITGAVVTFIDITDRLAVETELNIHREHLGELVTARTSELQNSNKALESFSYSVSHDLRTPLRAIYGFCQLLLEDHADSFNDDAQKYFNRITKAVSNMSMLIDDLLSLANVSQSELKIIKVDVKKIIQRIIDKLQEENPERNVTVNIDIKTMLCDKNLITIVWDNLIRNAWKYTGKTENATIEIGVKQGTDKTIYIKDNGVGFDMKFVDKIFLPFQRLHKKEEFEGTGIGLATVDRIITRHRGKLWAESKLNVGTIIYIKL
ncbi:MAG: ATP-binding protein [Gammaproteobacteria bacterium]